MEGAKAKEAIRAQALALGFAEARFAPPDPAPDQALALDRFLAEGRHGAMEWMAREPEKRADPRMLWPDVRSIVVLGDNYGPAHDPDPAAAPPGHGVVSAYALGRDYHDTVKRRLKALARFIAERAGAGVKLFVDTAPVMEKPLAARAGLGWIGRNTHLVSRRFGSWLFLGEIFTTLEIPPDPAEPPRCGRCHACETACPTGALEGGRIDPRRCVAYLTIEHRGPIPAPLRAAIGNRLYGCDDCLAICPWNRFARVATELSYQARLSAHQPLERLTRLDDDTFRQIFQGTAIKRIGFERMVRNAMIVLGNSARPDWAGLAVARLDDGSPLIRGAAAWAAGMLLPRNEGRALAAARLAHETDDAVRAEWRAIGQN